MDSKSDSEAVIYAGLGIRLLAFLMDCFLIVTPMAALIGIIFGYDELKNPHPPLWLNLLQIAAVGAVFIFFWARSGQTPGKKVLGLMVVDSCLLQPLSFFRCLLRYTFWVGCWMTILLGFFVSVFDKKRRTLADFACGSIVIKVAR